MAPAVIARIPNAAPQYIPLPEELLSCCLTDVGAKLKAALSQALGWESESEEQELRVLYKEKDVESSDGVMASFVKSLAVGQPCFVRVLFRLLGGKGGFGALLKKQMSLGKKTTNFDAMRDLSGRRLRHSKAVDRIKEWMEKKKSEDDLVKALTGEGPELPKPTPEAEMLDPDFVATLRRSAAKQPSLVREGMRKLDAEAGAVAARPAATPPEQKRARVDVEDVQESAPAPKAAGGWMNALEMLGGSSSEDSDDGSGKETKAAGAPAKTASAACAAAPAAEGKEVRCGNGHVCKRLVANPDEPGYDEPASCDLCDKEDLPGTCSHFFHCSECEFDLCPACAASATSGSSSAGAAAASSTSGSACAAAA